MNLYRVIGALCYPPWRFLVLVVALSLGGAIVGDVVEELTVPAKAVELTPDATLRVGLRVSAMYTNGVVSVSPRAPVVVATVSVKPRHETRVRALTATVVVDGRVVSERTGVSEVEVEIPAECGTTAVVNYVASVEIINGEYAVNYTGNITIVVSEDAVGNSTLLNLQLHPRSIAVNYETRMKVYLAITLLPTLFWLVITKILVPSWKR